MSIFHPRKGEPYHRVNSLRGIRKAKRAGFREIDLDLCITRDGRIVGTHWPRPLAHGFRDPMRRIPKDTLIRDLPYSDVRRLVAGAGYRIQTIETLLKECARVGIIARLEPKVAPFRLDWPWEHISQVADDLGTEVRMYALRNSPYAGFGQQAVDAARRHGIPGKVIR